MILHAVLASFTFSDNLAPKGVYRNSVIQKCKKKSQFLLGTSTCDFMVIPDTIIVPVAMVICVSIVIPVSMVTCFQGSLLARRVP